MNPCHRCGNKYAPELVGPNDGSVDYFAACNVGRGGCGFFTKGFKTEQEALEEWRKVPS